MDAYPRQSNLLLTQKIWCLHYWKNGMVEYQWRRINNLRYADDDDTVFIAARLCSISEEIGLELNKQKSKTMIVDRLHNNEPGVQTVPGYQVASQFNHLASMITNSGRCVADIRRRIAMTRNATTILTKIWRATAITRNTLLRIANSLIFPIAMYGSEIWTLNEGDKQRVVVGIWRRTRGRSPKRWIDQIKKKGLEHLLTSKFGWKR